MIKFSKEELFERYENLCNFKNEIEEKFVEEKLSSFYKSFGYERPRFQKCESLSAARAAWDARDASAARDAWAARDASAASAARDAWAARDARDARAARDASAAWTAWAARDAWAAWAAWAARDASAASAAWDATWISIICIGASELQNEKVFDGWFPIFQAAEKGLWFYYMFDDVCIWVPQPKLILEKGRLHNADGPAFCLPKESLYYWNGVFVDEKLIMRPSKITRDDIINEKNSEVSRAIAERLGWDEYMKRAETFLVDKWFDPNTRLNYELWDFKKRFENTPRLLKMESPELNDGTRPHYVEPVEPRLKTCRAARAWQFMKTDGTWPNVDECNAKPELVFEVEA